MTRLVFTVWNNHTQFCYWARNDRMLCLYAGSANQAIRIWERFYNTTHGQALRGKVGSATSTTSPNERLREGLDHLFRF